jgi:hypothetical protein
MHAVGTFAKCDLPISDKMCGFPRRACGQSVVKIATTVGRTHHV